MLFALIAAIVVAVVSLLSTSRALRRMAQLETEMSKWRAQAERAQEATARAEFFESAVKLALAGQLTQEMLEERRLFIDVDGKEAARLVADEPQLTILDVRSMAEYRGGHIPEARSFPVEHLESSLAELPREQPYLVYCAMGGRSAAAAALLTQHGFARVYNLAQGIAAWNGPRVS